MGPQRLWEGKSGQLEGPGWAGAWRDPPGHCRSDLEPDRRHMNSKRSPWSSSTHR